MNIKKLIPIIITGNLACSAFAQVEIPNEPKWQITVQVVDEGGFPVADANVSASYYIPPPPNATEAGSRKTGLTDTNGFVTISAHSGPWVGCEVDKAGYYPTSGLNFSFTNRIGDQWQPWNPTGTLILKKVGQPIAMYAKREDAKIPKENEPVGFDLMAGDWIAPYGAGKTADLLFTVHRSIISPQEFDADLKLTFSNQGDGIIGVPPIAETDSPLVMPRVAAETGYQSTLSWSYHNFTETSVPASGYFFRVRTILDENGNVKSALYGKIQGDVKFYVGTKAPRAGIGFNYYLNPTPNSRNVEFNPKQNLLGGLQPFEQVKEP
jgi:hypothetical protein